MKLKKTKHYLEPSSGKSQMNFLANAIFVKEINEFYSAVKSSPSLATFRILISPFMQAPH